MRRCSPGRLWWLPLAALLVATTASLAQQPAPVVTPPRQQPAGPAIERTAAPPRELPCPFPPLSAAEQKYVDDILKYWEHRSSKIERYHTKFTRWEYDPVFGPKDPNIAKSISYGEVKYSAPDKGAFRVHRITHYQPPQQEGDKAGYAERPGEHGEHWICDGKSIFMFDAPKKRLVETPLPPEMQGQAIVDGPLPFLFGAKAESLKSRYWVRVQLPPPQPNEYWIEVWPKRPEDATQYKCVLVILDEKAYLPIAIQVYDPRFDAQRHPARVAFSFSDRQENWSTTLQTLNLFHREFFEPQLPSGWTKVVERAPSGPAAAPPGGQAQRPAANPAPR